MVVKWELGSYLDAAIDIYTHLKIQIIWGGGNLEEERRDLEGKRRGCAKMGKGIKD